MLAFVLWCSWCIGIDVRVGVGIDNVGVIVGEDGVKVRMGMVVVLVLGLVLVFVYIISDDGGIGVGLCVDICGVVGVRIGLHVGIGIAVGIVDVDVGDDGGISVCTGMVALLMSGLLFGVGLAQVLAVVLRVAALLSSGW